MRLRGLSIIFAGAMKMGHADLAATLPGNKIQVGVEL
jgi:hypothetical protein